MRNNKLESELVSLSDFYFLIEATTKIQGKSMRLEDSWDVIKEVGLKLDQPKLAAPREKFAK